jgi:hypothetical protein
MRRVVLRITMACHDRSTNKKIALLEAKLLARQQAKLTPTSSRPGPVLSMREEAAASEWLDNNTGDKGKQRMTDGSIGEVEGRGDVVIVAGQVTPVEKQIKVDLAKAGLPIRPYFDAVAPDRREV